MTQRFGLRMTVCTKIFESIVLTVIGSILFLSPLASAQNPPPAAAPKSSGQPAPKYNPAKAPANAPAAQTPPPANTSANPSTSAVLPPELRNLGLGSKPIVIEPIAGSLEDRLQSTITLDVREMNVIDVLKFLALKGNFNMVTSAAVVGRVTIYLKNVKIQDALDIVLIANNLAYHIDNNIIQVMAQVEYEAMFGKKFKDKMKMEILQLKYAKPSYILSTLDTVKSNLGKIIIDEDTGSVVLIDTEESLALMRKLIGEMETPLEAIVYTLQYAKADIVTEKLKSRIDANAVGSLTMDERTNQIIVRAFPGRREEVEKLIKSLDKPTKEVMVEARILQVVFKPQYDFGIDWNFDFQKTPFGAMSFNSVYLGDDSPTTNLALKFFRFSAGTVNANNFQTAIRALKQVSDTKILSNPRLLVTNDEEAKIHIGDTVPYIISTTSGTGDTAITSEDVRFVDVGLKLNVTPTINEDGYVTMRLAPEISTVTTSIQSKGGGIPQVNKTLVETVVMVKDGETIIMGGLKKDNKSHSRRGFPVLMDLPWIGNAFSSTADSIERTEIVIFITPHIVKDFKQNGNFHGNIKPAQHFDPSPAKTGAPMQKSVSISAPIVVSKEQPANSGLKLKE